MFRDLLSPFTGLKIKKGTITGSDRMVMLFSNGFILYTPWEINNSCNISASESFVAKIICKDGYISYVLYNDEDELNDLKICRVYVQKRPLVLQVHHKHYMMDKKAWEYDDKDLVTLCQNCHSKLHQLIPVKAYTIVNEKMIVMNYTPCQRCNGAGYLPEYNYVENGICFRCRGARFEELIENNNYEDVNLFD